MSANGYAGKLRAKHARILMRMVKCILWCNRCPAPQLRHIRLHKFGGRSVKWENTTTFRSALCELQLAISQF
ncbi:hypothetical protein POVWA2_015800 [Plasmodium ovale wallikeri]|uniref:Uncharacterized protein n=1 Tax=Plasmodium ovale wallikeri TaxID=864142 RepID=A0A1A8YQ71_PLAOA|nr:hypothetical protein POVWA1_016300 [Plasmodium ovale wallikeri]SBT33635.1 hypothetical protein POVWA2_015800 [Plasmodium ovale wallikeri]